MISLVFITHEPLSTYIKIYLYVWMSSFFSGEMICTDNYSSYSSVYK